MTKILLEILKFIAPPAIEFIQRRIDATKERRKKEVAEKMQKAIDEADAARAGRRVEQQMKKATALDNAEQHR